MAMRNALTVLGAKHAKPGRYCDGQGLWLRKRRSDSGSWILRMTVFGRRREMGLGPWPDVTISEARDRASEARRTLRYGTDPIEQRREKKEQHNKLLLKDAVALCFKAKQAELKGDGIAGQWMSPLTTHVLPAIGSVAVEDIDQHVLKKTFEPIWHKRPESARKAINRIGMTMKHAAALGKDVDFQAVMKTKALLGKQRRERTNIPSLPYDELPNFYAYLKLQDFAAHKALRFLILTGARTGEVLNMRFDEIEGDVWNIPAERTKTNTAHRIPLSYEAMAIVEGLREPTEEFVFRGRKGKPLSNMAMLNIMKRLEMEARPHGFRATFRTWMEEMTDTQFEVKELALAHTVGDTTVRAYQRSDHLEKRRALMTEWARFCAQRQAET